jgi:Immunity protein 22
VNEHGAAHLEDCELKNMTRASKLHLWVGKTEKSQKDFDQYFDQTEAFLFDASGREKSQDQIVLSQFSKDIGKQASFDEDFLSIYFGGENLDLNETLAELEDSEDFELIQKTCIEKSVIEANAMFFYSDAELDVTDHHRKYNGLTYIGQFDSPSW